MVGELQVFGSASRRSRNRLTRTAVEHVADGERGDEAIVVAAAERRVEEEVTGLLEADQRLVLEVEALDVAVAGLPVDRRRAIGDAARGR